MVQCSPSSEVIYGFQIFKDSARNIVPCLGRKQEKACYNLLIRFTGTEAAGIDPFSRGLMAGGLVVLLVSLLFRALYLKRKFAGNKANLPVQSVSAEITMDSESQENIQPDLPEEEVKSEVPVESGIAIGNLLFLRESQQLIAGSSIITLTTKEAKLLHVFAKAQQEVIDRDQLMKEVWEDEGVIVGRSLDMFVSKLRKKLQADMRISILNVHGKGYKLVIGQMVQ
ncbi:helix-turn-helix domain-containing protein [Pseudoflavitalea sp. G-6-1-2]|nr:helix-turn-helix domain-containing protein [Pseudoflavitalea sp. G-6-1-2]